MELARYAVDHYWRYSAIRGYRLAKFNNTISVFKRLLRAIMNIEQERELFEVGEYSALPHEISSTHTMVEKETGRVVAVFYNDYDLESCVEQMQARAKVPSWISCENDLPVAETLVLALYRNEHIIIQLIYSEDYHDSTIWVCEDHSVEYELSDITHWQPLPPMNGE